MRTLLPLLLAASAIVVFMPASEATDYLQCLPGNAACVGQNDGNPGDPNCDAGYLSYYGVNQASDGATATAGGVTVYAMAHETCGHWFLQDSHSYGLRAGATTGSTNAIVHWEEYSATPNPYCAYGPPARLTDGTIIGATATSGGQTTGVTWQDVTSQSCTGGRTTHTCNTFVYVASATPTQDLGCPLGDPVSPPAPSAVHYGALLP